MHKYFKHIILATLFAGSVVGGTDTDGADSPFLSDAVWGQNKLPGSWYDVSRDSSTGIKQARRPGSIYGFQPQQVQAFSEGRELKRIVVLYLETGLFFGQRDLLDKKKLRQKRVDFDKRYKALSKQVPANITAALGVKGVRRQIGKGGLRSRVTIFDVDELQLQFRVENNQLVSLTILKKADAGRYLLQGGRGTRSMGARRDRTQANVVKAKNGDVLIKNIPMFNQGGRSYCAMGTLAMITRYYGLSVDIDMLAAKAGYKEGDVSQANVLATYKAASKSAKLKYLMSRQFSMNNVRKKILKGQPVIVWRYFHPRRDSVHTEFSASYNMDPSRALPDPRRDRKEKKLWPTKRSGFSHASIITGFNEDRKEVIFTESWGENNRNRRMRIEEMKATVYHVFYFRP